MKNEKIFKLHGAVRALNVTINRIAASTATLEALSACEKSDGCIRIPEEAFVFLCDIQSDLADEARAHCTELLEELVSGKDVQG